VKARFAFEKGEEFGLESSFDFGVGVAGHEVKTDVIALDDESREVDLGAFFVVDFNFFYRPKFVAGVEVGFGDQRGLVGFEKPF